MNPSSMSVTQIVLCYICSYENQEIALNCGVMLRECVRHEPLAKIILNSEDLLCFFSYVEMSTFDIASDAFATFKVCVCVCEGGGVCVCVRGGDDDSVCV